MIKTYICCCLLSALTIVEMKILNVNGHVGKNVSFICSDWDAGDVVNDVKYFCRSPCSKNRHIIHKAAAGKTEHKNRIQLINRGKDLFVTITDLQTPDSGTYYCGLERFFKDPLMRVDLTVTYDPKNDVKTVTVGLTVSHTTVNTFTVSSSSSDIITNMSLSSTTRYVTTPAASSTPGNGYVLYLIIGFTGIITILIVLLKILWMMVKKQPKVSNAELPQEVPQVDTEYDEIRTTDQTESPSEAVSTAHFFHNTDSDSLYANYSHHKDIENTMYSGLQLPKQHIEPSREYKPNSSEMYENDILYSLA